jgi:hypothetical protein
MTQSDIMGLAAEANLWVTSDERLDAVKKFAALVAAAEREACAQIAFNAKTYLEAAAVIRARGQSEQTINGWPLYSGLPNNG